MSVNYTFKQRSQEKVGMLDKIKEWYRKFKRNVQRKALTAAGIIATLFSVFTGQVFSAIVIGGLTYIFWKNAQGVDELVGTTKAV